jgi:hypothetical protein
MYEPIQLSQWLNIFGVLVTGSVAIIETILISGYLFTRFMGCNIRDPKIIQT